MATSKKKKTFNEMVLQKAIALQKDGEKDWNFAVRKAKDLCKQERDKKKKI